MRRYRKGVNGGLRAAAFSLSVLFGRLHLPQIDRAVFYNSGFGVFTAPSNRG